MSEHDAGPAPTTGGDTPEGPLAQRHRNEILARLPDDEDQHLLPHLQPMRLDVRQPLERQGEAPEAVYFPLDIVASVVEPATEADVEISTIGNEGVVGIHTFLGATTSPYNTHCQVPGRVLRLPVAELRTLLAGDGALHRLFRAHAQVMIAQLSRNVVCRQLHRAEQRTARWLLTTHDRVGGDTFTLTQDFLAQMLGVRRMTVSEVASGFQQQGLIHYTRGRITITDRAGMEAITCGCHPILRKQIHALLDGATG
jgi:CRP-like cAMP-binding protein